MGLLHPSPCKNLQQLFAPKLSHAFGTEPFPQSLFDQFLAALRLRNKLLRLQERAFVNADRTPRYRRIKALLARLRSSVTAALHLFSSRTKTDAHFGLPKVPVRE